MNFNFEKLRLKKHILFQNQSFQIGGTEVMKKYKISPQYLFYYTCLGKKTHLDMGCEYHYISLTHV